MSLINHEELKKQLASGEITSLDVITSEYTQELQDKNYKYENSYEDIADGIKRHVSAPVLASDLKR